MAERPDPDRWERLETLFAAATELEAEAREAYLTRECGEDAGLLRQLRAMLERDVAAGSPLTESVGGAIEGVVARSRERGNQRIGPYQILSELGRGGMGIVYLARRADDAFQKQVAIKIVHGAFTRPELLDRFRSERQILATLDHPHIARLLDGGTTDDGLPFVVMEYVEGEALDVHCDRRDLPLRERLHLFERVCQAVSYAHRNLVVHRDLKPSNILVGADGEPKLLDFGIAKLLDAQATGEATLTGPATRLLTPAYASPEQIRGDRIGTASDVYSLGVVLYELLTGSPPRGRNADWLEVARETDARFPSPSTAASRRELSGDVDIMVMTALQADPELRYPSALALAEDVQRHLEGHPISARPPTFRYRAGKFVRRNRLAVAVSVAAVVALVGSAAVSTTFAIRAEREREVAEEQRRSAERHAAIAQATNDFLNDDVLSAVAPGELGIDATLREALEAAAARLDGRFPDEPLVEASIRATIGNTFLNLGDYPSAEKHSLRALELRREALGDDSPETASQKADIASLYLYEGRYAEAESLAAAAEDVLRRSRGADDADRLRALALVGAAQMYLGRGDSAERALQEAVNRAERTLGATHEETLTFQSNLAVFYRREGRYRECLDLRERLVATLEETLGEDHPLTLAALNNLVGVLMNMGRNDEAWAVQERCYELRKRVLGPDHPGSLVALTNLARLSSFRGDHARAEALGQQAVEAMRRVLGADHRETLTAQRIVAAARKQLGAEAPSGTGP